MQGESKPTHPESYNIIQRKHVFPHHWSSSSRSCMWQRIFIEPWLIVLINIAARIKTYNKQIYVIMNFNAQTLLQIQIL
jgi:hypothetical protein